MRAVRIRIGRSTAVLIAAVRPVHTVMGTTNVAQGYFVHRQMSAPTAAVAVQAVARIATAAVGWFAIMGPALPAYLTFMPASLTRTAARARVLALVSLLAVEAEAVAAVEGAVTLATQTQTAWVGKYAMRAANAATMNATTTRSSST
jgi:hypothetical protein